ncbi:hypothetical protein BJX76DRAFT_352042 [Aspergillus varians]
MVGPPYSSVGCTNCRKRKIKCDLRKPECSKCLKRGILCLGFDKDRKFLHHDLRSEVTRSGEAKRPVRQLVWHLKPLSLPFFCSMSAVVRTQLFSAFMDTFFAPNPNINGRDDSFYFLMANFPTLAGESEPLDRSVIALVCSFLATKSNDSHLARQGLEIYNSALNAMARALQKMSGSEPNMLYATIIFHTYETLYSSDGAAASLFAHIQGASALTKQYGFIENNNLASAMLKRQKWAAAYCSLNTECGLEANWGCLNLVREASPIDKLFGMVGDCAAVRRDLANATRLNGPEREASLQSVGHRLIELKNLQADWNRLHGSSFSANYRGRDTGNPRPLEKDTGLTPHEFEDLNTAKTCVLFGIVSTVTLRLIYQTEKLLRGYSDPTSMLLSAGEVCRSVAYCMRPNRQMSVGHLVLFAASQASKAYIDCGDMKMFQWCQGIYSAIQARGIGFASRVSKGDWALWYTAQDRRRHLSLRFDDNIL